MPEPRSEPMLYTPEQAAEVLMVHVKTVYVWLRRGRLNGRKIGGVWRIPRESLEALINGNPAT